MGLSNVLFQAPQFSIPQAEKESRLLNELIRLTKFHKARCQGYARICSAFCWDLPGISSIEGIPFLPVNIFKTHRLLSVPEQDVYTEVTSSGTTGQAVSRVCLDRNTAGLQSKALVKIITHVLGPRRLPMIIIDSPSVIRNRHNYSARSAGVLGMMRFGFDHLFALDENMVLQTEALKNFLERHTGQNILVFGFTFMVWRQFYQEIKASGIDLESAVLIHSGGWKKLHEEAITNSEFKNALHASCGIKRIYNFYGLAEQIGSVFLEGEDGYLYPPNFADVIIRDPISWKAAPKGKKGVIQVLSILPESYPGHSILTEDLGVLHGIDDSKCGRLGKRFEVIGRIPQTELRGCSDTFALSMEGPL